MPPPVCWHGHPSSCCCRSARYYSRWFLERWPRTTCIRPATTSKAGCASSGWFCCRRSFSLPSTPKPILRLFLPADYHGGGTSLRLQTLGFGLLTILGTLLLFIMARGDFYTAVLIGLAMVVLLLPLAFVLIPEYGTAGAASSFALTVAIGTIICMALVYFRFGVLMPRSALLKSMVATAILIPLTLMLSATGPWMIPKYLVITFVYAGLLWALGELRREDFQPIFRGAEHA